MILYAKHPTRNVLKRQILIDSYRFHQGLSLPNSPKISLANIEFRLCKRQCFMSKHQI